MNSACFPQSCLFTVCGAKYRANFRSMMPCAVCHQPSKRSSPICTPWIHEYRTRTTDHGLVQKLENEPVDGLEGYDFVSQIRTIDEGESTLPNGKELANGADLPQSGDGWSCVFWKVRLSISA
mmetsp:Transcript_1822/g.5008  ORF Transcript_1822/g.5008 Transcript_1822/m.5008 type:complete len:123 (+) Transcript_1822:666-1034(+)